MFRRLSARVISTATGTRSSSLAPVTDLCEYEAVALKLLCENPTVETARRMGHIFILAADVSDLEDEALLPSAWRAKVVDRASVYWRRDLRKLRTCQEWKTLGLEVIPHEGPIKTRYMLQVFCPVMILRNRRRTFPSQLRLSMQRMCHAL